MNSESDTKTLVDIYRARNYFSRIIENAQTISNLFQAEIDAKLPVLFYCPAGVTWININCIAAQILVGVLTLMQNPVIASMRDFVKKFDNPISVVRNAPKNHPFSTESFSITDDEIVEFTGIKAKRNKNGEFEVTGDHAIVDCGPARISLGVRWIARTLSMARQISNILHSIYFEVNKKKLEDPLVEIFERQFAEIIKLAESIPGKFMCQDEYEAFHNHVFLAHDINSTYDSCCRSLERCHGYLFAEEALNITPHST